MANDPAPRPRSWLRILADHWDPPAPVTRPPEPPPNLDDFKSREPLCNGRQHGVTCAHYFPEIRLAGEITSSSEDRTIKRLRWCTLLPEPDFLGNSGEKMRLYCGRYQPTDVAYDRAFEEAIKYPTAAIAPPAPDTAAGPQIPQPDLAEAANNLLFQARAGAFQSFRVPLPALFHKWLSNGPWNLDLKAELLDLLRGTLLTDVQDDNWANEVAGRIRELFPHLPPVVPDAHSIVAAAIGAATTALDALNREAIKAPLDVRETAVATAHSATVTALRSIAKFAVEATAAHSTATANPLDKSAATTPPPATGIQGSP